MINISATILTFNEERRIGECLESLQGIADEIIVVDSFSTDSTLDICRRFGCKITQRHLAGFGAQRQYATSLTTHPYVLAIDADEALSPALQESLLKLKQSEPQHRVYAMSRLNFYCGVAVRHCGWYPDVQTRLFDKRYANWNLRDVHERVIFRDSVRPQILEGDLLHNRCDSPDEYSRTLAHQSDIRAAVLAAKESGITPLTPYMQGLGAFFRTYLRERGVLDGSVGLAIARHNYFARRDAYAGARRLRRHVETN